MCSAEYNYRWKYARCNIHVLSVKTCVVLVKTFVVLNPWYYVLFFFLYKTNAWLLSLGNSRSLTGYGSLKYFARNRANKLLTFFQLVQLLNQINLLNQILLTKMLFRLDVFKLRSKSRMRSYNLIFIWSISFLLAR